MNQVHNKAIFEQRGFVNVCSMFPEFRDSRRWMALAVERTRDTFLAQTTPDGVQREWSFGYNCSVLRDAVDVMRAAEAFGVSLPADYRERVRRMYDYIFSIATPELAGPMFGDASRSPVSSADRSRWSLYSTLTEATTLLDDPKYAALAKLDLDKLPEQTSYAFTHAGTYVLRDQWGPEQVYFALHCPPLGISGHDQPDNGTFELKAYGRWLMPDTGFYTYGHDAKARQWHRQTSVHQTLTLDGKDSKIDGRQLLWKTAPGLDVVTVENPSYPGLVHRRTVWFVQHKFFVILDEAMGEASGKLDLHFQFAPGEARIDAAEHRAATLFPDVNVLVWMDPKAPVTMEEEEGWFAWEYGHRTPRKAFRYRCDGSAPAAMLSVVYPYRGTQPPAVSATVSEAFRVGADRCEILVEFSGQRWQFGRDLDRNEAWGKSRL
jgi:hypothetical protein